VARIGVLTCQKIRDIHCMGCVKCHKALAEKLGGFAEHEDEIEIVFWAGCGDCPGMFMPKMTILDEMAEKMGREYDVVHLGTCMQKAVGTADCPLDLEDVKAKIEGKWGKKVIIGTHPW
jgi:predicted metal-binding protein